jgi:hypothetical protein
MILRSLKTGLNKLHLSYMDDFVTITHLRFDLAARWKNPHDKYTITNQLLAVVVIIVCFGS